MKKVMIILFMVTLMGSVYAQKPAVVLDDKAGWHKISETSVNFKTDKDEIIVLVADKFKALKFKVTQGAIDLQELEVYYSEGDKENIIVKSPIAEGKESRVIDLKGYERELKKVVFVYKTIAGSSTDKAHVELYGMK